MPEQGSNPLFPTFQAGSFTHCTRAPVPVPRKKCRKNLRSYKIAVRLCFYLLFVVVARDWGENIVNITTHPISEGGGGGVEAVNRK